MAHSQRRMGARLRRLLALFMLSSLATVGIVSADSRPFGDARILAKVPTPPGFPEASPSRAAW